MESRTDHLREKLLDELERHRVWLDRVPTLRSLTLDVKLVTEGKGKGTVRVILVKTESE